MIKKINIEKSIWVIGDVHGEYDQLITLLNKLPKDALICFVGDLIDRGSKSKEVVKFIKDNNHYCVLGNHEEIMTDAIKYSSGLNHWFSNGGLETVKSYIDIPKKFYEQGFYKDHEFEYFLEENKEMNEDIKWFEKLPRIIKFSIENEKPLYVSHSGIGLFKTDEEIDKMNTDNYIVWNRSLQVEVDFAVNIHGHSITSKNLFKKSKSQIDIDTGAFLSGEEFNGNKGFLTAIEYPSLKRVFSV